MTNSVIDELERIGLPLLQGYQADLVKHDRAAIEKHPQVPFLWFCRDLGTHLIALLPADDYPPEGVLVPYLFGTADRHHMLKEPCTMVAAITGKYAPALRALRYFDGKRLHDITAKRAQEIASEYTARINREWDKRRA